MIISCSVVTVPLDIVLRLSYFLFLGTSNSRRQHCPWCKRASGTLPSPSASSSSSSSSSSSTFSSSSSTSGTNRHHHRRKHKPRRGRRHYDSVARSSLDKQRIDAIKEQILSKLGMTAQPNITKSRSTRFLVEAMAVEPLSGLTATDPDTATGNTLPPSTRLPVASRDADSEPDDFYGRTKEIIGFAEPGECLLTYYSEVLNRKTRIRDLHVGRASSFPPVTNYRFLNFGNQFT